MTFLYPVLIKKIFLGYNTGHLEENNVYIDEDRAIGEGEDDLDDYDEVEDAYDKDSYVKEQEQGNLDHFRT